MASLTLYCAPPGAAGAAGGGGKQHAHVLPLPAAKVAVAARYANVHVDTTYVPVAEAAKHPAVCASPFGQLPVLGISDAGVLRAVLPRTNAILRYVAGLRQDAGLLGYGPFVQVRERWIASSLMLRLVVRGICGPPPPPPPSFFISFSLCDCEVTCRVLFHHIATPTTRTPPCVS